MISTINHVNIEETGISYQVFRLLDRAGFGTVGEVIKKTDQQLLEIEGIKKRHLEEIKREIFDSERVLEHLKKQIPEHTDCIEDIKDFTIRIKFALYRAGISTISELRQMTDYQLSNIRNLGVKSIAIIDTVVPDRIKMYEGEAEEREAHRIKYIIDRDAKRIMRYMAEDNETLSQLTEGGFRYSGNKKARRVMADYCATFPERIPEVLRHFEAMNDTADVFYKRLKQAQNDKISV